MAVLQIPVTSVNGNYFFQIELDTELFTFRFNYNQRGDFWTMSIEDVDGVPIIEGHKVVTDGFPLGRVVLESRPFGDLMFLGTDDGSDDPAGETELGDTVNLFYEEALA